MTWQVQKSNRGADDLPSGRSPRRRGDGKLRIYSRRFYRKKWFIYSVLACFFISLILSVGVIFWLKEFKEDADKKDLSLIDRVEKRSTIMDRNGEEIGKVYIENRKLVSIEKVPYQMIQALTAIEDSRFFEHHGIDYLGIVRAAIRNVTTNKGYSQGASTITQQLARGAYAMKAKTLERKLREAFLARRIEKNFSKPKILELYLNRIYFGNGCYGVAAASEGYFNKDVEDLTLLECATLCGLIKNPYYLSPLKYPEKSKNARNYVLTRMAAEKMITSEEAAILQAEPLGTNPSGQNSDYSYVNDQIFKEFSDIVHKAGYESAMVGGFTITTTIDLQMQRRIRDEMRKRLTEVEGFPEFEGQTYASYHEAVEQGEKNVKLDYLQGAVVVMNNKTGGIIAMVGGRDFSDMKWNYATQSIRSIGSAFKPFVYGAAFEDGKFPGSLVYDSPMKINYETAQVGELKGVLGEWAVESDRDVFQRGEITMREALIRSKNNSAVRVTEQVDISKIADAGRRAGLKIAQEENHIVLGKDVNVNLVDVCRAYTAFPNLGVRQNNTKLITRIVDNDGKVVYDVNKDPGKGGLVKVFDPIPAFQVHSCLHDVLEKGTGAGAMDKLRKAGEYSGGKTGTAYNFTDNWFVGYNSEITCGVWVGFDRLKTIYRRAFSNETAMPIWIDAMNIANESYDPRPISPPEDTEFIEICTRSGKRALDNCHEFVQEGDKTITVRTTYLELVAKNFKSDEGACDFHSNSGAGGINIAMNLEDSVTSNDEGTYAIPVKLRGDIVIGPDPYHSVKPAVRNEVDPRDSSSNADILPQARRLGASFGDEAYRIPIPVPPPIRFPGND